MKKNKMTTKFFTLAIVMFFALFTTSSIYAQDCVDDTDPNCGESPGDDVNDQAPIDSYLYAGLIAGAALGYTLLRKKQTTVL